MMQLIAGIVTNTTACISTKRSLSFDVELCHLELFSWIF